MIKYTRTRYGLRLALLAALACGGLSSCGGGSGHDTTAAADVVAHVGTRPITRASVEHWMSIMLITDGNDIPKEVDAKRVVPQPPTYSACVTDAKMTLKTAPRAQLKRKCALLRQALQEQALEHLISTQQLYAESAEHKVSVSDAEATKRLDALKREQFPSPAAFTSYLRITGQTIYDQLERIRFSLLTAKLLQTLTGASSPNHLTIQQSARLAAFASTSDKWRHATTCAPAYAVPLCSREGPKANRPVPDMLITELGL